MPSVLVAKIHYSAPANNRAGNLIMKYRTLGNTDTAVSEISLGAWQLGGADWGNVSDDDAFAILQCAVDKGINFFDTANVYGQGRSETLIGRFLADTNTQVHVATKLGRELPGMHNGWPKRITLDMAREATVASIKRLGVDSLFLQQWHCIPTDMLRDGEAIGHLKTLQKEGLIQHFGISVETVEEALIVIDQGGAASLQVIFNIFRQKLVDELLPKAKAANVGLLARVPLASGVLSGKFSAATTFGDNDHRNYNADGAAFNVGETFAGVPFAKGVELAEQIDTLTASTDAPLAQRALRWILDHDAITCAIPGATKLSQVESNAAASDLSPLGDDIHTKLRDLYDTAIAPAVRGAY